MEGYIFCKPDSVVYSSYGLLMFRILSFSFNLFFPLEFLLVSLYNAFPCIEAYLLSPSFTLSSPFCFCWGIWYLWICFFHFFFVIMNIARPLICGFHSFICQQFTQRYSQAAFCNILGGPGFGFEVKRWNYLIIRFALRG